MKDNQMIEIVKSLQCAGCTRSFDDGCYVSSTAHEGCVNHSPGTYLSGVGSILLGMPKGFNRVGDNGDNADIRIHKSNPDLWDFLNVPIWHRIKDGLVYVRTYSPRVNRASIDVYPGDTAPEGSFNLDEKLEEID